MALPSVEEEEYIVYAYEGTEENANLNVSICGRTAPLGEAQADLDALGEGYAPQAGTAGPSSQQPQDTGAGMTWVIVVVVVAGGCCNSWRCRLRTRKTPVTRSNPARVFGGQPLVLLKST